LKHERIATNGVHLHVVTDGPADGPLVVLLHGFPEFWYSYRKLIPFLAERGFRVMAPDMRGYNESEKPDGVGAYGIEILAQDIVGLIDAAGRERAQIVAHDWGGGVAWWMALRHPARVEKLVVLNSPHPSVLRRHITRSFKQMKKSWYMLFFQLPFVPEIVFRANDGERMAKVLRASSRPGAFSDEDLEKYKMAWRQPGAVTAMLNYYRALVRGRPPREPGSLRVKPPTLLIWGVQDTALARELAPMSIDLCDDGRLVFLDEATHWVLHEEPERVSALIEGFLAKAAR
jgi:pimeloyl-ACP methyl ester carboxylesterase